ncbi:hypothetical protein D3C87_22760 [compost metagenome]
MTEGLAIEIAEQMMRERGISCENYLLRYRHLVLGASETRQVSGKSDLYILLSPVSQVRVFSRSGVYDTIALLNEAQYVHTGEFTVSNLDKAIVHVKFLQVIPKND